MKLAVIDRRDYMPIRPAAALQLRTEPILGVAIHHSATVNRLTGAPLGDAGTIFRNQVFGQGWDHGAYHYVINAQGQIEYTLSVEIPGYHAGFDDAEDHFKLTQGQFWNQRYLAICLIGWFDRDRQDLDPTGNPKPIPNQHTRPSPAQRQALERLLAYLSQTYDLPIENMRGHRELAGCDTVCPGQLIDLDEVRAVQAAIQADPNHALAQTLTLDWIPVRTEPAFTRIPAQPRTQLRNGLDSLLRWTSRLGLAASLGVFIFSWTQPGQPWVWLMRGFIGLIWLSCLPVLSIISKHPRQTAFMRQHRQHLIAAGESANLQISWTPFVEIPFELIQACVAQEDHNFAHHFGFAWGGLIRAWRDRRDRRARYGASTISQQLIKNLFLWPAPSIIRKVIEAYLTAILETLLSKRRILELYLNTIQWGKHQFGAAAAVRHYFDKPLPALTFEEATLLAAAIAHPVKLKVDAPNETLRAQQQLLKNRLQSFGSDFLKTL
jgi:monofunctional biosynthetic peptidoglycan transglycosylase